MALFLALFGRLWFLQALAGDRYGQLAESNRVQLVALEAPRGRILAVDGQELVKNRPAQTISADRWNWLNDTDEDDETAHYPLINRSIQSAYPPGSVRLADRVLGGQQGHLLQQGGDPHAPAATRSASTRTSAGTAGSGAVVTP